MLTLHKTIEESKWLLKWGTLIIISLFVLMIIIQIGANLKEKFFPTPPPPPTVTFGKLPKILFPQNVTNKKIKYIIDTLPGNLPSFPDRLKVYSIASQQHNLIALQKAKERVQYLGFFSNGNAISDSLYRWEKPGGSETIILDILSLNFSYTFDEQNKEKIYTQSNIQDKANAIAKAQSFIGIISNFPDDIDTNKTSVQTFRYKDGALEHTNNITSTNIIRVDFLQKNIDGLPVLYPHPPTSTMYAIIGGSNENPIVTESSSYHMNIQDNTATYPIKTAQEAFSQLENGDAFVVSYPNIDDPMPIKNVYLGYYINEKGKQYLMPIFIFEGKDGFLAYVSAIKDAWIK